MSVHVAGYLWCDLSIHRPEDSYTSIGSIIQNIYRKMKRQLINLSLLAAAAICAAPAWAVPAKPGIHTITTADGSELRVQLVGDEFFHQYLTEDGIPIFERDGNFYFGDVDASGNVRVSDIKVTDAGRRSAEASAFVSSLDMNVMGQNLNKLAAKSPRRAAMQAEMTAEVSTPRKANSKIPSINEAPPYERGYGLFPELRFPAYGEQKAIVILVEYQDVKFSDRYNAADYFTRMLNEDGFSDYNATGCAAEYFRLNSGDAFRPEFDVFGPVTLSQPMKYYGGNDSYGNDMRPAEMVKEACELLNDQVDFSEYDRDVDGIVDNVFVFYAGRGEASGGSASSVWPHSWNMTAAGYPALYFDGVRVHTYGCTNEWTGSRPDGVGTFIHEFSHVMGLPDLYATSYTNSFTPGSWSVLDYGPYNNNGMTPPNYGVFERYALGWMKPREINGPLSVELPTVDNNVAGVIRTDKDTEFFLVENRQQTGWDTYIPGHGMLVWHVDYDEMIWRQNIVNNNAAHQYVDLEEADGSQSDYSRSGDCFPGTAKRTQFSSSTNPAMKTWGGVAVDFPITNIAENNGIITFDVLGGSNATFDVTAEADAKDVGKEGFTITWTPVEGSEAIVNVYTRPEAGAGVTARAAAEPQYVAGFRNRNLGQASSVTLEGLDPGTTYYYTVAFLKDWLLSEPSAEQQVETTSLTFADYAVSALDATAIGENSFTANWEALEDAEDYLLTVYSKVSTGSSKDVCDFTTFQGGYDVNGWTSDMGRTYKLKGYYGAESPSLQLTSGADVVSPVYDDYISSVKFWHRGNNTNDNDVIYAYYITAGGRRLLEEVEIEREAGGAVVELTSFPEKTIGVALQYVRTGTTGFVTVDDIEVVHGETYSRDVLSGYSDLSLGQALSHEVKGLKPGSGYSYVVRAKDGDLYSASSREVDVRTAGVTGVEGVADAAFAVVAEGLTLYATTADEMVVYDMAGAEVARGTRSLTLPVGGLYIVTVPAQGYTAKVMAR